MGLIFRSLNLVAHCHLLLRTAHRKLSRNPPGTDITKKLKFAATLLPTTYNTYLLDVDSFRGIQKRILNPRAYFHLNNARKFCLKKKIFCTRNKREFLVLKDITRSPITAQSKFMQYPLNEMGHFSKDCIFKLPPRLRH